MEIAPETAKDNTMLDVVETSLADLTIDSQVIVGNDEGEQSKNEDGSNVHPTKNRNADGSFRVLHNRSFGGFNFSKAFKEEYMRRVPGLTKDDLKFAEVWREDEEAIKLFDEMGCAASSGKRSCLKSLLIPPQCTYRLREYDGLERVIALPDIDEAKIVEDLLLMVRQTKSCGPACGYDVTHQLLDSGMTLEEFHKTRRDEMKAYQAAHPWTDKP